MWRRYLMEVTVYTHRSRATNRTVLSVCWRFASTTWCTLCNPWATTWSTCCCMLSSAASITGKCSSQAIVSLRVYVCPWVYTFKKYIYIHYDVYKYTYVLPALLIFNIIICYYFVRWLALWLHVKVICMNWKQTCMNYADDNTTTCVYNTFADVLCVASILSYWYLSFVYFSMNSQAKWFDLVLIVGLL